MPPATALSTGAATDRTPFFSAMSIAIKIKKGLDLDIEGKIADRRNITVINSATVAMIPDDFQGMVPKMEVREGDKVLAGTPIWHDKAHENVKVTSPVAGEVLAVVRGERRKILRVVISNKSEEAFVHPFEGALSDPAKAKALLCASGVWAMMTQRPYAVVPDPDAAIRDIFVTGFDSAPLACDPASYTDGDIKELEAGVQLLSLLTTGKVYVSRRPVGVLPDLKGAEMVGITGPHPAGNAGTMIASVRPVNKGETVLCLDINTLRRAGAVALTGKLPGETLVAVTGSEVKEPRLVRTVIGAEMKAILAGQLKLDGRHHRIISGNVLTGVKTSLEDGFLRMPWTQVTVIPEGDDVDEFMGWASFSPSKMSTSPSFPGRFLRRKPFEPDARLLGGRRAMIMSGEYDKVMPMDILPEYLIKAILAKDIDRMEQLGIYEVAPEDFALAEYADTSKLELQKIVRDGLDYLRKELE